jgi:ubiquinone/menaquinone biosynthesis C-methylase UbiE
MSTFSKSTFNFSDKEFVSVIDELPLWSAPFGLKLLDAIILKPNITALDIGFGLGFPLIEMAQRLGNSSKVYGIDPWETAVERAQSKIKMLGLNNIKLISGVAEDIPLPDHSVDLIVSNNGINNVQNLERVMSECGRIAKTSAQFVATVNLDGTMIEFYNELGKVLTVKGLNESVAKLKKHIYDKRKPVSELLQMFERNGFRINNVQHDSFKYRYVDATVMFNHSFIKMAFMDSWLDIVPQEQIEEIFGEVENRLNEKAKANGEFILTVPLVLIDAEKL